MSTGGNTRRLGRRPRATALAALAFAASWLSGPVAIGCSIPVFRYARENWPPDSYEAVVFLDGPLEVEHRRALEVLCGDEKHGRTNIVVYALDVNASPGEPAMRRWRGGHDGAADHEDDEAPMPGVTAEMWREHGRPSLPWMALRHPGVHSPREFLWAGEVSVRSALMLRASPSRAELGRRLSDGEGVVWVLLESGDAAADAAAASVLDEELSTLQEAISLPSPTESEDEGRGDVPVELRPRFSVLRSTRSDRVEDFFTRQLLSVEPGLAECREPMAFPVFGRGRVLYALLGAGISRANVAEACHYLSGPCSCAVKAANPGVDLLMAWDWSSAASAAANEDAHVGVELSVPLPVRASALVDEARGRGPSGDSAARSTEGLLPPALAMTMAAQVALAAALVVWATLRMRKRIA